MIYLVMDIRNYVLRDKLNLYQMKIPYNNIVIVVIDK